MHRRGRSMDVLPVGGSFVGRAAELQALEEAAGDARLITITGIGGGGKSRLALEFLTARRDGARPWHVACLEGVRTPEGICGAIAVALELPDPPDDPEVFGAILARQGPAVVLLDGFEAAVEGGAALIEAWSAQSPDLSWLITSRLPLRIRVERQIRLAPLAPDESMQLLIERVRAVDFRFDPALHGGDLEAIVERLGGIPLALELAASRLQVLAPAELRRRLSDKLDVLRAPHRTPSTRHATVAAVLDWSWSMLSAGQQAALAQCSAFRGSFTVEAAEAIVSPPGAGSVLDQLEALVSCGLLQVVDAGAQRRLRLLHLVRCHAEERLSPEEAHDVHARHAAHVVAQIASLIDTASSLEHRLRADQLDELLLEVDELDVVIRRAGVDPWRRAQAAIALLTLLDGVRPTTWYAAQLEALIPLLPEGPARARARLALVEPHRATWHLPVPPEVLEADARVAEAASDPALASQLMLQVAWARGRRDPDEGRRCHAAASRLARTSRRAALELSCRQGQLLIDLSEGPLADHLEPIRTFISATRAHGYRSLEASWSGNLAFLLLCCGDVDGAVSWGGRALELFRALRRPAWLVQHLLRTASTEVTRGAFDRARSCLAEARATLERFPHVAPPGVVDHALAGVLVVEGRPEEARRILDAGSSSDALMAHLAEGALALHHGAWAAAVHHYDRALEQIRARINLLDLDTATTLALRALAQARRGDAAAAATDLHEAQSLAEERAVPVLSVPIALIAAAVRLVGEGSAEALAEADACWRAFETTPCFGTAVIAHRLLGGLLAQPGDGRTLLRVGPQLAWVQRGAATLELGRSPLLRRLLQALIESHRRRPGTSVSVEALLEIGWPGDRSTREALENRLRVALSKLRRLGLADVITHGDEGYAIDASISIFDDPGRRSSD